MHRAPGVIIAAPASGSGKTIVTAALLRHLANAGVGVAAFKVGPDYIDPAFLAAASRRPAINLDGWAMRDETVIALAARLFDSAELVVGEGVMGLFDGATDGTGSTADVAARLGLPVVLTVDVRGQGASAAALVAGFARHRADVEIAGVIFNRVGGPGHERILRDSLAPIGVPALGAVPRDDALTLPERHLGLVQAREAPALEAKLDHAAAIVAEHVDMARLKGLARPPQLSDPPPPSDIALRPLGQRIAVAHDEAFAFAYPALLDAWHEAGAELRPFSPLADEAPDATADAVYLPGGYPELHAGALAANRAFMDGLRLAARGGATVFGECGGYMVLGRALADAEGRRHAMAGLLPIETSFAAPRLHLGYRTATLAAGGPLGPTGARFRGHEFHYAEIVHEPVEEPLFHCRDAEGRDLGSAGARAGTVLGSFIHLIDRA